MRRLGLDTLIGRFIAIILGTLLASHLIVWLALAGLFSEMFSERLRNSQIANAADAIRHVAASEGDSERSSLSVLRSLSAERSSIGEPRRLGTAVSAWTVDGDEPTVDVALTRRIADAAGLGGAVTIAARAVPLLARTSSGGESTDATQPLVRAPLGLLDVELSLDGGERLGFTVAPLPHAWPPPRPLLLLMGLSASALTLIAVLLATRLSRPFRDLADAADRLAAGEPVSPLALSGPREVRLAQQAFNVMSARLQALLGSQRQLLSAIGHDLRTPLTTLRLRTAMIDDDTDRQHVRTALEELASLTEAALNAARGTAGGQVSQVDLDSVLASVSDDLVESGHTVRYRELDRPAYVLGWPADLRRLFRNLAHNAVRYGKEATIEASIDGSSCRVTIEDRGMGIPKRARERVFEPFVRLETSRSRDTGGSGLGLYIARHLVESHGGTIELDDRPDGPGLCVRVTLPLFWR